MSEHSWIQTYTGRTFYPLDPRSEDVCIEDIAHALSVICRYGGHCKRPYSVAQHSVHVAELVEVWSGNTQLTLTALLHDASEAYISDIVRPVKKRITVYAEIEHNLEKVIADRFGLVYPFPQQIKDADDVLLMTERRDLMMTPPRPWSACHAEPLEREIPEMGWQDAKQSFLEIFRRLSKIVSGLRQIDADSEPY